MKNTITASVEFYFKGIQYLPTLVLDLDELMQREGEIPENLYIMLAEANNIGTYSYELEMMEAEEIVFSEPQGLAVDFAKNGEFDIVGFEVAWRIMRERQWLTEIASKHLGIEDLDAHPDVEAALAAAYQQGKNSR